MRLLLIRHGESVKTDKDTILSKKGIRQAKLLAKRLHKMRIAKAYVSDLTRAQQTFAAFKKLCPKIPCETSNQLREIYRVIIGGPPREGTPQERKLKDKKRADNIFSKIIDETDNKETVALFIHGNLIRYYLAKALHLSRINLWETLIINDASISIIEISQGKKKVKMVNNISHLDKEEVDQLINNNSTQQNYFS